MTKVSPTNTRNIVTNIARESKTTKKKTASIIPASDHDKNNAQVTNNYTYKNSKGVSITGTLYKYKDGHCTFECNSGKIPYTLEFDSVKDLERARPKCQINYPGDTAKQQVISYKYSTFGKLKERTVTNAQGKVAMVSTYDDKGRVKEDRVYNTQNDELKNVNKYEYKDNQEIIQTYDSKDKLLQTKTIEYAEDKKTKISETVYNAEKETTTERKYTEGKKTSEIQSKNGQVLTETTFYPETGAVKDQYKYDENGQKIHTISSELDLNFGYSRQVGEGDCYLMSAINGILGAEGGKEYLKSLVNIKEDSNGKKTYTVTLPGAIIAAQGLKSDKRIDQSKMYITGVYEFTQEEIDKILPQAGKKYSLGNANVILLEAAFEKYREEVKRTMRANNINANQFGIAGLMSGKDDNNILAGGQSFDAAFILTGSRSKVYNNNNPALLSYDDIKNGKLTISRSSSNQEMVKAGVSEIDGDIMTSQADLDKLIEQIREDYKDGRIDNITTVSFNLEHADGKTSGHALTIIGITDTEVIITNPWYPETPLHISIKDFKAAASKVCVSSKSVNQLNSNGGGQTPQNNSLINNPQTYQQIIQITQNNNNGGTVSPGAPSQQTGGAAQDEYKKVEVRPNISYTNFIKEQLAEQGINNPTKEQIAKAKKQFEAANPRTKNSMAYVHIYNGPKRQWKGNKYLIKNIEYNVPKFNV